MQWMLLAAAGSLVAIAAPAQAQVSGSQGFAAAPAAGCSAGRHHRRGGCDSAVVLDVYGGDWAYYNNRSFNSDSYNDWWHDRPDRAFPRWMHNNQNCERMWWSGGGWRC